MRRIEWLQSGSRARERSLNRLRVVWLGVASVAAALAATLAFVGAPAAPAFALDTVSIETTLPSPMMVGDVGRAASVTITNGDNAVPLQTITLVPSCATRLSPASDCSISNPGVFALSASGTGAAGTACAGVSFTITNIDASQDKYAFQPASNVVLAAVGGGDASRCEIDFTVDVLKVPGDAVNSSANAQTAQIAYVAAGLAEAYDRNVTTVLKGALSIAVALAPSSVLPGGHFSGTATLDPRAGAAAPTGNVHFELAPPASACAAVSSVDVPLNLTGTSASSGDLVPTYKGTWQVSASYAGDVNYGAVATACGANPIQVLNTAPIADADSSVATEDTLLVVAAPGVLDGDTDADGDPLTATLVTDVSHGSLDLDADGSFTYTPATDFSGSDTFTYKANDGTAESSTATVTINVGPANDPPLAVNDGYGTSEDQPLTIATPGVLANDTDIDLDALTAVVVSGPGHGTLTMNPSGGYTYTPHADFNGTDTFTYEANDGTTASNTATVTITVAAVDDPGTAQADAATTAEDTPLVVDAPGVLANDSDPDSPTLTATMVTGPTHGTLALDADGAYTYTPAADFSGTDTFTYSTNGGAPAIVTITVTAVNDAPASVGDTYTLVGGAPLVVPAPGVLGNDGDVDTAGLRAVLVTPPTHGVLVLNADGSFTYTPNIGYSGLDSFTYRVADSAGDTLTLRTNAFGPPVTVTLTITAAATTTTAAATTTTPPPTSPATTSTVAGIGPSMPTAQDVALPETGADSGSTLLIAIGALLLGLASIAIVRKRRYSTF